MSVQKIAVVTGANRGLGKEIAKELAEHQVKVILTARDPVKGQAVCDEFELTGLPVLFHALDVSDEQSMQALAKFVQSEYGRLDILVNNAATGGGENSIHVSMQDFRKTMETNFFGPFRLSQLLIPLLRKSESGRIINISSGMGALNRMGGGDAGYRVSKTALNAVTAVMAADLHGSNILVNTMCPGWVKTDMGGAGAPRSVQKGSETAVWLALERNIPSGKFFRDKKVIDW